MEHILIVEDEDKIARFIQLELEYEGYQVTIASNGRAGLDLIRDSSFDLVVLDLMLPEMNGMEVLRRVRAFSDLPIILLTARDSVMDKVSGLDGGADDYLTKPFEIEELLARIRLLLRKADKGKEESSQSTKDSGRKGESSVSQDELDKKILIAGLSLDPLSYEVKLAGRDISLTKREFDLLHYLMENQNIVLSRDQIMESVWGYDYAGESNTVDVYIRYLRSKLEDESGRKFIETVRGVGYVIRNV